MANPSLEEAPPPEKEYVTTNIVEPAREVFFYQRMGRNQEPVGEPLALQEREAALFGKNYKFIGKGDGQTYRQYLIDHGIMGKGKSVSVEDAKKILQDAFKAELEKARGNMIYPVLHNVDYTNIPPHMRGQVQLPQ